MADVSEADGAAACGVSVSGGGVDAADDDLSRAASAEELADCGDASSDGWYQRLLLLRPLGPLLLLALMFLMRSDLRVLLFLPASLLVMVIFFCCCLCWRCL